MKKCDVGYSTVSMRIIQSANLQASRTAKYPLHTAPVIKKLLAQVISRISRNIVTYPFHLTKIIPEIATFNFP